MSEWVFEHSVDAAVPPDAAWAYWTDVSNWTLDSDIEWVRLEGPFASGSRGMTKSRSADHVTEWRIREATPGRATIEVDLPGAVWSAHWTFEPNEAGGTRISQRVVLSGPQAAEHISVAETYLVPNIPQGMRKLVEVMENARR
jgi:hypothetical protein